MPLYEGLGSGGEKTAVVIDLGEAFTKCGFAGETGPRCIIPSVIKKAGVPKPIKVVQYNINTEELYSYLKEFIHILYFRHLLVNPRDRRVVVIESVLCPSHFRETLTRVLFKYFEVPSVLLAPSHLMALLTLGINSAMVLDCGYRESLVLPQKCTGLSASGGSRESSAFCRPQYTLLTKWNKLASRVSLRKRTLYFEKDSKKL
uniref:Actin related protein 10 n=1 Tax=Equus caballus TaxID=9796 RepID=A0A9L0TK06_HORSE